MAEYKLKNGYVLTDEEIERRAAEWESDDAEIGLVPLRVGRPPLSGEPNANLSFKCPESGAELIARAARGGRREKVGVHPRGRSREGGASAIFGRIRPL